MAVRKGSRDVEADLNKSMPAADAVKLGTLLNELVNSYNALLAKLDADTGVTDANYASSRKVKALGER